MIKTSILGKRAASSPSRSSTSATSDGHAVLQLQRQVGNHHTRKLLGVIQRDPPTQQIVPPTQAQQAVEAPPPQRVDPANTQPLPTHPNVETHVEEEVEPVRPGASLEGGFNTREIDLATGHLMGDPGFTLSLTFAVQNWSLSRALHRGRPLPFLGGTLDLLSEPNLEGALTFNRTPTGIEPEAAASVGFDLLRQAWQRNGREFLEVTLPVGLEVSPGSHGVHIMPQVGAQGNVFITPNISLFGNMTVTFNREAEGMVARPNTTTLGFSTGVEVEF